MDRRFFILHSSFFIARYLRMKVLLSTYSCFPCKTSEPGNAWRAINEALREHEVWAVIADAHQYRELTLPVLQKNPLPNFHPIFQRLPAAYQWMSGHSATTAIYYHLWQEGLRRTVRDLHQKVKFDLVHHVTYGRYWSPSGLRELDLPFIWGPLGAAETPPREFVRELHRRAEGQPGAARRPGAVRRRQLPGRGGRESRAGGRQRHGQDDLAQDHRGGFLLLTIGVIFFV